MSSTSDLNPPPRPPPPPDTDTKKDKLKQLRDVKDTIATEIGENPLNPDNSLEEKVSTNAKKVLVALFMTLFGIVALYTVALGIGIQLEENLNTVFIAAVTGIITLGGTLVTNLWGK